MHELTGSLDEAYLLIPYCEYPVITFVVEKDSKTFFSWTGIVPQGRTAFMQIYNFAKDTWETVSTKFAIGDETIQLGFDYQGLSDYEKENKIYFRISSAFTDYSKILNHSPNISLDRHSIHCALVDRFRSRVLYVQKSKQCLENVVQYIIADIKQQFSLPCLYRRYGSTTNLGN